jgi:hypothetical protein
MNNKKSYKYFYFSPTGQWLISGINPMFTSVLEFLHDDLTDEPITRIPIYIVIR